MAGDKTNFDLGSLEPFLGIFLKITLQSLEEHYHLSEYGVDVNKMMEQYEKYMKQRKTTLLMAE